MGQTIPIRRNIVLDVEDEPLSRMAAIDMVEGAGFEVVEVVNANEAVPILERRTDMAIVFTDNGMPGSIYHLRLAAAVRERWPPIEILIVSGVVKTGHEELPSRRAFYPQPYDERSVIATVRAFATAR